MPWLHDLKTRLRFPGRGNAEARMDEEMRFHLEMEVERLQRGGVRPDEARRRAMLAFGGMDVRKEEIRSHRSLAWLEAWMRDVRHALRGLGATPLFTGTMVLTLGLGVGATASLFGVADALILRPLPYHQPERLVQVMASSEQGRWTPYVEWDAVAAWRAQRDVFVDAMAHVRTTVVFAGGNGPRTLSAQGVMPNFEEILGVRPMLGRGFEERDADPAARPVVLLDHAFWRNAFGADPEVVGRVIHLEGRPHEVVGVMPEGFKFPDYSTTEAWIPIRRDGSFVGRPAGGTYLLARTGDDPLERVQVRADARAQALARDRPRDGGWSVALHSLQALRTTNPEVQRAVSFLAGAVALLLLLSAVNATSLLLVRNGSRARELAVRAGLGASRRRIAGQLLTESLVLALASGVAATLLAFAALRALRPIIPDPITFFAPHAIEMEWRTLAFTFAVATATGMLAGLGPVLRAAGQAAAAAPAGLSPYAAGAPRNRGFRRALVVGEVAISVVLLLGAGLLVRTFAGLVSVDPGFRTEEVAVMTLSLAEANHPTRRARAAFLRALEERLEAVPGVAGVALADAIPPDVSLSVGVALEAEGSPPPDGQPQVLPFASVGPGFFELLRVPVVAGRAFAPGDAGSDRVIVDRPLARFLWGDSDPVGRRFRVRGDAPWLTVVGVTADLKLLGPDDRSGRFELLYPLGPDRAPAFVSLVIGARGSLAGVLPLLRAALYEVDVRQPVDELRPASEIYAEAFELPGFLLVVTSILAGVALLLSAVGIYGVMAYGVVQRRRELGIRMALGAHPGRLSRWVLREGTLLAGTGIVLGCAVALALAPHVRGVLFGVEPTDPGTYAAVAATLLGTAVLACCGPALRATRADPVQVMRAE